MPANPAIYTTIAMDKFREPYWVIIGINIGKLTPIVLIVTPVKDPIKKGIKNKTTQILIPIVEKNCGS